MSQQSAIDTSMSSESIPAEISWVVPNDNSVQKQEVEYWVRIESDENNCINNQKLKPL